MKSRGLRGSILESIINNTIEFYRKNNLALIQKIPTPITPMKIDSKSNHITLAYFEKKSTVDYIGVVQEIPVCFDAKECEKDNFPLKNVHEHQYEFMRDFEKQGGISFLVILFKNKNICYYMPFSDLDKYMKRSTKTIKFEELQDRYFIDSKNKIKIDILSKIQIDIDDR